MSEEQIETGDQVSEAAAPTVDHQSDSAAAEKQVPLDALQAERAERQKLQDEVRMMKDYLSVMQSQQSSHKTPEPDPMDDDDVLTVGEAKKYMSQMSSQYETKINELQMAQKYPDYEQVITKYLPEVLKQNPSLRNSLEKTQDYELAYHLAKNNDGYRSSRKSEKKNADAERIVQNSAKAGSLSSLGQSSPINAARRYKEMSDADFQREVNKNLGY